jgi:hypothetical protein
MPAPQDGTLIHHPYRLGISSSGLEHVERKLRERRLARLAHPYRIAKNVQQPVQVLRHEHEIVLLNPL